MMRGGRLPDRVLADLLGRLGTALGAGIDLRRAWALESARAPARWRPALHAVAAGLASGESLATALARPGDAFPPVVRALVAAGDAAGRDAECLRDVAEALERAIHGRRELRRALAGPALRLAAALAVVVVLILVNGAITDLDGRPVDILGLGLAGRDGAVRFAAAVAALVGLAAVAAPLVARSWSDRGIAHAVGGRIPILGPAVRSAEAAAWCRAAGAASHAGLDAGRLVALASGAAPGLRIDPRSVEARLRQAATLQEALAADGRLPRTVLEAVGVGELTGTTAETLDRLADRLDEEARAGFTAAVGAVGFLAWAAVAGLVALIVFRFASFYVGLIHDATKPL